MTRRSLRRRGKGRIKRPTILVPVSAFRLRIRKVDTKPTFVYLRSPQQRKGKR